MSGADEPRQPGEPSAPDAAEDKDTPAAASDAAARKAHETPATHDAPQDEGDLPEEGDLPLVDEVDVRELLREALRPPQAAPPNLLRGVQRRLRSRSRGKFYGDGWSTSRSPRSTYLMTSILMLALIAFVFLVLVPWGGGALP